MQSFIETLCTARKSKSLTLRALAEKLGVSYQYYHELETGKRLVPLKGGIIEKIAEILDLDIKQLYRLREVYSATKRATSKLRGSLQKEPKLAEQFSELVNTKSDDEINNILKGLFDE